MARGRLVKRSVSLAGHRTSLALEAEFWSALEEIAAREGKSWAELVAALDAGREADSGPQGLASAVRVYVLQRGRSV